RGHGPLAGMSRATDGKRVRQWSKARRRRFDNGAGTSCERGRFTPVAGITPGVVRIVSTSADGHVCHAKRHGPWTRLRRGDLSDKLAPGRERSDGKTGPGVSEPVAPGGKLSIRWLPP